MPGPWGPISGEVGARPPELNPGEHDREGWCWTLELDGCMGLNLACRLAPGHSSCGTQRLSTTALNT